MCKLLLIPLWYLTNDSYKRKNLGACDEFSFGV